MEYGTKFVLLKYGRTPHNCIDLHRKVIDKEGSCWFGKIGVAPSRSVLKATMGNGLFKVLLYCQDEVYLCNCINVTNEKPSNGVPSYYDDYLYGRGIYPKIYFCFDSIEKIEKKDLSECVILSSRNNMFDTIKKSMASFFYVEVADSQKEAIVSKTTKKKRVMAKKDTSSVESNDCIFREDGICANTRCINFEYECDRPSNCAKQKTS